MPGPSIAQPARCSWAWARGRLGRVVRPAGARPGPDGDPGPEPSSAPEPGADPPAPEGRDRVMVVMAALTDAVEDIDGNIESNGGYTQK
ncbi:hypothetical protein ACR8A7_10650 [Clavibacter sepedonicus]|uniref:hypothetical protein n=1 Tax=Clavibacter sepedonicus TaxID=31964 RepID=UPI003DA2754D